MEGKRAVTHPTNTTGPKGKVTSSSETKKPHKTKTKQKNPTPESKTNKNSQPSR